MIPEDIQEMIRQMVKEEMKQSLDNTIEQVIRRKCRVTIEGRYAEGFAFHIICGSKLWAFDPMECFFHPDTQHPIPLGFKLNNVICKDTVEPSRPRTT